MGECHLIGPMNILDDDEDRPLEACSLYQACDGRDPARPQGLVVHGIHENSKLGGLRQIKEIVQEDDFVLIDESFGVCQFKGRASRRRRIGQADVQKAAYQSANRVTPRATSKVENEGRMAIKTMVLRDSLELLDQSSLANSSLAADEKRLASAR
ncbi:hypothetical protein AJ87_42160 [Rhizobium yanglingense]|nr:hypothetical protein AJ87_42160 [Rhizobium yanglingense]